MIFSNYLTSPAGVCQTLRVPPVEIKIPAGLWLPTYPEYRTKVMPDLNFSSMGNTYCNWFGGLQTQVGTTQGAPGDLRSDAVPVCVGELVNMLGVAVATG